MKENLQKNWWLVALRGALAILFGLAALFSPLTVIFSLLTIFSFFLILSGFAIVTLAFLGETESRWLRVVEGVLFILTGTFVIFNPAFAVGGIMIFIAAWAIMTGAINIINAIKLRKVIANEWLMILNGALSVIFGILISTNLLGGAMAVTNLFGIFALLSGLFMVMLSFRIRGLKED
ncbi:MAG: HdeD family acid-resistance protein [Ignavibacteria bacterium]